MSACSGRAAFEPHKAHCSLYAAESCNEVQGYLMGRPHPILEYSELIGCNGAAEANQLIA
jgi:hypothetical protein